jgi:pimeloyl-ACP methyl ester carboxylesterase
MPSAAGLYYFAHGMEDGARLPVVLVHGAGGTHLNWPPDIRRLPGRRVCAVDLPGHGASGGVGRQSLYDYADDLAEFMPQAGLRAAVIVGHSMGGGIALSLAIRRPERVLGLCLMGSGAQLSVSRRILGLAAAPQCFRAAVHLLTETSYASSISPRFKELAEERMSETRPAVLYGDLLACDVFDVRDELSSVRAPTLIVCGDEDQMTPPPLAQALKAEIPGSRLVVLPGAGHMLMLEQPAESAAALEAFLDRIPFHPGC